MNAKLFSAIQSVQRLLDETKTPTSDIDISQLRWLVDGTLHILSDYPGAFSVARFQLTKLFNSLPSHREVHADDKAAVEMLGVYASLADRFLEIRIADSIFVNEYCLERMLEWMKSPPNDQWTTPEILEDFSSRISDFRMRIADSRQKLNDVVSGRPPSRPNVENS